MTKKPRLKKAGFSSGLRGDVQSPLLASFNGFSRQSLPLFVPPFRIDIADLLPVLR